MLFYYGKREIEVIYLKKESIIENLDILLEKIGFTSGNEDFILVEKNFQAGLCVERIEYHYELISWGL